MVGVVHRPKGLVPLPLKKCAVTNEPERRRLSQFSDSLLSLLWPGAERTEQEDYLCVEERLWSTAVPSCSPQNLQAAMQLVNIQVLAFTPPHTLPWRVYLYTHTQHAHLDRTPHSTVILGELLYTGGTNHSTALKKGACDEEEEVKVTLKQRPRDAEALNGFLSILTTVLHTLSSEGDQTLRPHTDQNHL